MQYHCLHRLVYEEIQEAQGLRIRPKGRETLRIVRVRSFIRCYEVDSQPALGGIARDPASRGCVWDLAKSLVDRLQNLEHGRCLISHRNRAVGELRNVDVIGLEEGARKPDAQHGGVTLIRHRSDQYAAEPEDAHPGKGCDDVADLRNRGRKSERSHQRGD